MLYNKNYAITNFLTHKLIWEVENTLKITAFESHWVVSSSKTTSELVMFNFTSSSMFAGGAGGAGSWTSREFFETRKFPKVYFTRIMIFCWLKTSKLPGISKFISQSTKSRTISHQSKIVINLMLFNKIVNFELSSRCLWIDKIL